MKAAVVTLSDKGFRNEREDKSGELVQMMLKEAGYEVAVIRQTSTAIWNRRGPG